MMDETFLAQDVVNKQYDNALNRKQRPRVKVRTFIGSIHLSHQFEMPFNSWFSACMS